jgi:hypothetical protein
VLGGEAFYDDIQLYMGYGGYVGNIGYIGNGYTIQTIFTRVFEDLHPISPILLFCWEESGEWRVEKLGEDFRQKEEILFLRGFEAIGHLGSNITTCTTLLPL